MMKNQLKSLCASVTILLSASLSAENISVVYDSADLKTTYGDGVVSIGYDGDNSITSLSAKPGDTANNIDFTGDDATFSASSSAISLESLGSLVFKNQLLASGQSDQELAVMDLNSSLQAWTGSASMEKPTATSTLLAKGVALAAITNITASLAGTASGVDGKAAVLCFPDLSNDGKDLTCQFQLKSSSATLRSILLRFTQEADDIYVNVVGYGHISYSGLEYNEGDISIDKNIQNLFDTKATWTTGVRADCYIANLTIFYDTDKVAKYIQPRIVFAASNVLENVDLNIGKLGGICLEIAHSNAFPVSGKVKVLKNSRLVVNSGTPGNNTVLNGIDNGVPITVEKDGVLEVKVSYAFDADESQFILNGGEFLCNLVPNNPEKDSSVYIHNITFRDGAKIAGNKFRIRANETVWKAEGSSPSSCDCGIIVWTLHANTASNFKYSEFIVDVDDIVSGVDFYLNGTVELPSTETYTYCTFIKRGLGTMRIGNEFKMTNMPTRIEGGTFFVDGNHLNSQLAPCSFILAGGILAVAADSTNSCGELQVESSSTLQIPDGASISFASSKDSQAWTGILTVDANLDACSVRFGSDENGLSASQRIKIRTVDGRRVKLDETGRLYPADGFMLFVR